MNKADGQDTADRLSAIVANSPDTQAKTQDLARKRTKAARSSTGCSEQWSKKLREACDDGYCWKEQHINYAHTGTSVTDVALDANYGSLEAFTRAFRRFRLPQPLSAHA